MNCQFPTVLRPLIGRNYLWRKNSSEKVVYLTFDDGPVPEVTPQVLSVLDDFNIKATFFCVGDNVNKYPELYREILLKGHSVGNHTFHHLNGFKVEHEQYLNDVEQASQLIDSRLFRPPYGKLTRREKKILEQKFQIVLWDVISYDYDRNLSPSQVLENVKHNSRNGSVILFHDSVKAKNNMLSVLPDAINFLLAKGFRFERL
ncbi:MAG TPA: polysaccharide deacetylase family protein [Paludibacteraceae bacterium]|jgi:peptidoglycan/xylan/chitin deacetylase (PgdA/CDA1 family)|nr:polysaccharide deacetylase family protein [Paludibacteraceae bacterium]MBP9016561.1 polysaccharide deacetylase family protein [Paludibacteraceae bacterium]HNZ61851.1 polysaccharide deacetylase family protein [Paludibacteraceae bacterium]HOH54662.1 polysaccharide deacetylase family protein [Paludibacteraceae bacterium]